jgi:amidase
MSQPWQTIVAKKRAQQAPMIPNEWKLSQEVIGQAKANPEAGVADIPAHCGLLTPKEIEITEKYDAVGLVESLAAKRFTASEVTLAFCKRAAIAQQLVKSLS